MRALTGIEQHIMEMAKRNECVHVAILDGIDEIQPYHDLVMLGLLRRGPHWQDEPSLRACYQHTGDGGGEHG